MTNLQLVLNQLQLRNLDGIVINLQEDGWYTTATKERNLVSELTGFNCSAALLLIWKGKVHLFLDPRYYQAGCLAKLNATIHHYQQGCLASFLAQNCSANDTLGIVAPSFSQQKFATFLQTAAEHQLRVSTCGLELFSYSVPTPAPQQVSIYQSEFSGSTASARLAQFRSWLTKQGIQNYWLTDLSSISWLLQLKKANYCFSPLAACSCLVSAAECYLLISSPLDKEVASYLAANRITVITDQQELFQSLKGETIWLDQTMTSAESCQALQAQQIDFVHATDSCQQARAIKNPTEQYYMRLAAIKDSVAFCRLLAWLEQQLKVTEEEVSLQLELIRKSIPGYQQPSFPTIAAAGKNAALPHYQTANAYLASGEVFLLDAGGQYDGGTTDATRTVAIDSVFSAALRNNFTALLSAHIKVANRLYRSEVKVKELAQTAQQSLAEAELVCPHALGHGVDSYGSVHAAPLVSTSSEEELRPGMIITNEPGVYLNNCYGLRHENMYLVNQSEQELGLEPLTLVPFDRRLLVTARLAREEKAWLNNYHQLTLEVMSGFIVEPTTRAWLQNGCQPI